MRYNTSTTTIPDTISLATNTRGDLVPTFFTTLSHMKSKKLTTVVHDNIVNRIVKLEMLDLDVYQGTVRVKLYFYDGVSCDFNTSLDSFFKYLTTQNVMINQGVISHDFVLYQDKSLVRLVACGSEDYLNLLEQNEKLDIIQNVTTRGGIPVGQILVPSNYGLRGHYMYLGQAYGLDNYKYSSRNLPCTKKEHIIVALTRIENNISGPIYFTDNEGNNYTLNTRSGETSFISLADLVKCDYIDSSNVSVNFQNVLKEISMDVEQVKEYYLTHDFTMPHSLKNMDNLRNKFLNSFIRETKSECVANIQSLDADLVFSILDSLNSRLFNKTTLRYFNS